MSVQTADVVVEPHPPKAEEVFMVRAITRIDGQLEWVTVAVPIRFKEAIDDGCIGFDDCAAHIKSPGGLCIYMMQGKCLQPEMAVGKTFFKMFREDNKDGDVE